MLCFRDRSRLEKTLDQLDPSRNSVADAMLFCIDHSEVADEIIAAICKSLASPHDLPLKKVLGQGIPWPRSSEPGL